MNPTESSVIKMFGPCISDPSRIVNRDIPACDELAYKAAGYQRGSIPEPALEAGAIALGSESEPVAVSPIAELPIAEPIAETPKPRKKKGQN